MKTRQQIRVIADCGNLCGEGPLWVPEEEILYWTDITGKRFFRFHWKDQRYECLQQGFEVAGFTLQDDGSLVVTNAQGVWLWSLGADPILVAADADGQKCVLNDCIADPEGRVYAGSKFLTEKGEGGPSFLFRVNTDGSVHVAADAIEFSNGLAFSPDCATLYLADTVGRCIYAYDWRRKDGELSKRRVLVRIPREQGVPDGITVDAQGFLWCAHWFGGCITRYDPDGKLERRIDTPSSQTSSLAFGGPDLNEIFITSAGQSNALVLAPEGYDPEKVFVGGPLYAMKSDVQGKLDYRSSVSMGSNPALSGG